VKLRLTSAAEVESAFDQIERSVTAKSGAEHFHGVSVQPMIRLDDGYEIILGSSLDPQFGPVLLFGAGGQLVEVLKDRALGLPPLNATLARRMMEQTRIYTALRGVRGRKPVDLAELERILVRFSRMVAEQRWIREIDINPLLVSADRIVALDARVVLHPPDLSAEALPRLAVRPYPVKYVQQLHLRDSGQVTIRPIRPEDEPLMIRFHQTLSDRSVRLRYFHVLKLSQRVAHERLIRVCFADYDREMPLVAERCDKGGESEIVAVARLSKIPGRDEAEFALLVSDLWQNRGLGSRMLEMLIQVARDEGLATVSADILPDNLEMQHVCQKLGFDILRSEDNSEMHARISLK
jgi:acetyltransferase